MIPLTHIRSVRTPAWMRRHGELGTHQQEALAGLQQFLYHNIDHHPGGVSGDYVFGQPAMDQVLNRLMEQTR